MNFRPAYFPALCSARAASWAILALLLSVSSTNFALFFVRVLSPKNEETLFPFLSKSPLPSLWDKGSLGGPTSLLLLLLLLLLFFLKILFSFSFPVSLFFIILLDAKFLRGHPASC